MKWLMQFGHSKDDPNRAQIKLMTGSLDPLRMPLASDVLSGERADDGLYIPLIKRIDAGLSREGLLFVGDCKMSALETRAHLVRRAHFYLCPLPLTGTRTQEMKAWVTQGLDKDRGGELSLIFRQNDRAEEVLVAGGYELERGGCQGDEQWTERVLVVRSPLHAEQQVAGLDKRLANAEKKLTALTRPEVEGDHKRGTGHVFLGIREFWGQHTKFLAYHSEVWPSIYCPQDSAAGGQSRRSLNL